MTRLLCQSDPAWVAVVLDDFDVFLADHANCERKAAAMAMAFVSRFKDRIELVDAMLSLAQEELSHFAQVFRLMTQRGVALAAETPDPYVNALRKHVRHGGAHHLLDQLAVAGIVEARGCERFGMVAAALPEGPLKTFYMDITRSEARHGGLFLRLARQYFEPQEVSDRVDALLQAESDIVCGLPHRPALH